MIFYSLTVLKVFSKTFINETRNNKKDINIITDDKKVDDGIVMLEALSATCLRSIRYAKEVPGVKKIIANDISEKAVQCMKENVRLNNVEDIVETTCNDAV